MTTDSEQIASTILLERCQQELSDACGAVRALRDVELEVAPGEFLLVRGPLRLGQDDPDPSAHRDRYPTEGLVLHDGLAIGQLTEAQRAEWRGREVGVVFQFFQLLPT